MSRITAPALRLAQTIGSPSASASVFRASGSVLAPKYADLLSARTSSLRDHSEAHRTLSTTPNPLRLPLSTQPSHPTSLPVDVAFLPNPVSLRSGPGIRVPILPDTCHSPFASTSAPGSSASTSESTIVAANPEHVAPASMLTSVKGLGSIGN